MDCEVRLHGLMWKAAAGCLRDDEKKKSGKLDEPNMVAERSGLWSTTIAPGLRSRWEQRNNIRVGWGSNVPKESHKPRTEVIFLLWPRCSAEQRSGINFMTALQRVLVRVILLSRADMKVS